MSSYLKCIDCGREYSIEKVRFRCECGGLLEVIHGFGNEVSRKIFDERRKIWNSFLNSGVWRFKELVHPLIKKEDIVSKQEGNTNIYFHEKLCRYVGIEEFMVKHEGENPTGSFKDRGMTVGVSEAKRLKNKVVACASTGNTSASLAAYAATAAMKCIVFIPKGKVAYGKLSQALAYGGRVLEINGNFDFAMKLVQETSKKLGLYLLNSVNPWRLEGQKTIVFELIQQLNWEPPDWIIVPAGNLGNTSAFGKALKEMKELGLIEKVPHLASIQAEKSSPFYETWKKKSSKLLVVEEPETVATAIRIGNPVNWKKALKAIKYTKGVVEKVTDQEIMDAKAVVDSCGIGCEPASAASIAGAKKLREKGVIEEGDKVVSILTGHLLKDPDSTMNYHRNKLPGIEPRFCNTPVSLPKEVNENKLREVIFS